MEPNAHGEGRRTLTEEALSDWAWLGRLCRRLVTDPGLALDAQQEAWIAAAPSAATGDSPSAARTGRKPRPNRAELAFAVRQYLWKWRRGESRRELREAERAQYSPSLAPSAADLVQRNEQYQRVWAAVLGLDEPLRDAVILRFQEGLSPAQIAGRRGIAADTARWRVRRGLETLRTRLERDPHGGGLGAIAAALPLNLGVAATSKPLALVLAMKSFALLGAGALAVLAVLALRRAGAMPAPQVNTSASGEPSAVHGDPGLTGEGTSLAAASPGALTDSPATLPSARDRSEASDLRRVSGRVALPTGEAGFTIPAVAVSVELHTGGASTTKPLQRAITDSNGTFRFDLRIDRAAEVSITPPLGYKPLVAAVPPSGEHGPLTLGELVLAPRNGVIGRVLEGGLPVQGAEVAFVVNSPILLGAPLTGMGWRPGDTALKEAFSPTSWSGRGVKNLGGTVPRAWLQSFIVNQTAHTDTDGRFFFPASKRAAALISVKHGAAAVQSDAFAAVAGRRIDVGDLALAPPATLRGRVVSPGGAPYAGLILALDGQHIGRSAGETTTDSNGAFEFTGLAAGTHFVEVNPSSEVFIDPRLVPSWFHIDVAPTEDTQATEIEIIIEAPKSRHVDFEILHNGKEMICGLNFMVEGGEIASALFEEPSNGTVRLPVSVPMELQLSLFSTDPDEYDGDVSTVLPYLLEIEETTERVVLHLESGDLVISLPSDLVTDDTGEVRLSLGGVANVAPITLVSYVEFDGEVPTVRFEGVPADAVLDALVVVAGYNRAHAEIVRWTGLDKIQILAGETTQVGHGRLRGRTLNDRR